MDTKITFAGYTMQNPVIAASGTFGFGWEFADYYDINILGSISLKGTTLLARYGNPLPRIAECPAGLINAIGLQNPGAKDVVKKELPRLDKCYKHKVMANVGGHSVDEYIEASSILDAADKVWAVELNVSCPNVKGGGMAFGTDAKTLESLVYQVKKHTLKPLIVKLSPNVTDIAELAKAAEDGGADGISLINTLVGMRIDIARRTPVISVKTGGYSGAGVYPVALAMVYKASSAVKIPVMGLGGISTAEQVVEMMMAGATAVQVGTQNLINPYACKEIVENLPEVMDRYNVKSLADIIGAAK